MKTRCARTKGKTPKKQVLYSRKHKLQKRRLLSEDQKKNQRQQLVGPGEASDNTNKIEFEALSKDKMKKDQ
jgi:hypothetical protein